MRAPVIDAALPGVGTVFGNGVSGTGGHTVAASIAKITGKGRIWGQGSIGNEEDKTDVGAEFGGQYSTRKTSFPQTTDFGGLCKIHDDIRGGLAGFHRFGKTELVGVKYLRILGFVALDPQIGHVALDTGIIALVLDHSSHFQKSDLGAFFVLVFDTQGHVIIVLGFGMHQLVKTTGYSEPHADDTFGGGQDLAGIPLGITAFVEGNISDAHQVGPQRAGLFFDLRGV